MQLTTNGSAGRHSFECHQISAWRGKSQKQLPIAGLFSSSRGHIVNAMWGQRQKEEQCQSAQGLKQLKISECRSELLCRQMQVAVIVARPKEQDGDEDKEYRLSVPMTPSLDVVACTLPKPPIYQVDLTSIQCHRFALCVVDSAMNESLL